MLCPTIENAFGLVQAAAREQQLDYSLAVSAPLLDLVEIAMVGDQGLVSFFVRPVAHCAMAASAALFLSIAPTSLTMAHPDGFRVAASFRPLPPEVHGPSVHEPLLPGSACDAQI